MATRGGRGAALLSYRPRMKGTDLRVVGETAMGSLMVKGQNNTDVSLSERENTTCTADCS